MTDPPRETEGDHEDRFSDEEAGAALKRAAQLQLEAAERVEHATAGVAAAPTDGYGRRDLIDAAAQVGIDEQYVALALREQADRGQLAHKADDSTLLRWLGTKRKSLSVSRSFEATGQETLDACCRVFESPRFGLQLRGATEGHPLEGGVLEFTMPRLSQLASATGGYTPLAYRLEQIEMWTLRVTFRTRGARTEVVIHGDLRPGALANLRFARWSAGVGGALGGGAAGAVAAASWGLLGLAAAPALVGAAAAAGLLMLGYRKLYSSVLGKTEQELQALLDGVGGDLTRRALVSEPDPAGAATPALAAKTPDPV